MYIYILYKHICIIEVFHLNSPLLSDAGILQINVNVKVLFEGRCCTACPSV